MTAQKPTGFWPLSSTCGGVSWARGAFVALLSLSVDRSCPTAIPIHGDGNTKVAEPADGRVPHNGNVQKKQMAGLSLSKSGAPCYLLVFAFASVQQLRPEFRNALSDAWQIDRRWQLEEPGQRRAVVAAPVLKVMICIALLWNWWSFAGIITLGFAGMLLPNEVLRLLHRDLVFPSDAMLETTALYVPVKNLKTSRFARKQRVRVDDGSLIFLAWCMTWTNSCSQLQLRCFDASGTASWTGRQPQGGATPGTLRGLGATRKYIQSGNIAQIQWKGSLNQLKTLEHYATAHVQPEPTDTPSDLHFEFASRICYTTIVSS